MNQTVEIETELGKIKGEWSNTDFKMLFIGALFDSTGKNILAIEFSFPCSFITKYGEHAALDEIKDSAIDYIKSDPTNAQS